MKGCDKVSTIEAKNRNLNRSNRASKDRDLRAMKRRAIIGRRFSEFRSSKQDGDNREGLCDET